MIRLYINRALLKKKTPLFDMKILDSYVIEVADSESDFGFYNKDLVSEIFALYRLQKNALRRPGCRGYVQLVLKNPCPNSAHLKFSSAHGFF